MEQNGGDAVARSPNLANLSEKLMVLAGTCRLNNKNESNDEKSGKGPDTYAATGDSRYWEAEDRLADFLCRIQIRSEAHPELDGGWFRAFDFNRWEYWASSGDAGWGAWCIESGWTRNWITIILGLRQLKTSIWDYTAGSEIEKQVSGN